MNESVPLSACASSTRMVAGPKSVAAILALAVCVASAPAGELYFSQDANPNGLYKLNTTTGAATLVGFGLSGVGSSTVGLAEGPNGSLLYGSQPFGFLHINSDGSGSTLINSALTYEGIAYDPINDVAYGVWWNNSVFERFNPTTGTVLASLTAPPDDVEGLAYHNGVVYGLAGFGGSPRGNLWAYSVAFDTWSLIGNTSVSFDLPGLAYDPDLNMLYGIGAQDSNLYLINPITAAATIIGSTGLANTGGGLAYVVPEPSSLGLAALALAMLGLGRRANRKS